MPRKIGAIMLFHTDHTQLAKWYQEMLDIDEPKPWGDDHYGAMVGDIYVGFNKVDTGLHPGSVELHFTSDDIDADFATIKGREAKVLDEPKDQPWGGRTCMFEDPAGNKVWLMKMPDPS